MNPFHRCLGVFAVPPPEQRTSDLEGTAVAFQRHDVPMPWKVLKV